ncbi:MAG: PC4/YdbC family ssDNA-binding protein [bacterium]
MAELFKYEIVKKLGTIGQESKGWAKEINLISWNDRKPKLDIRQWTTDGKKMGKGISLNKEELTGLKKFLEDTDLNTIDIE